MAIMKHFETWKCKKTGNLNRFSFSYEDQEYMKENGDLISLGVLRRLYDYVKPSWPRQKYKLITNINGFKIREAL
jgi:hypothetical protein